MLISSMTERLDLLISQHPKMEEGALEEDDKWSLDVCGYIQDLEERKEAFNHKSTLKDRETEKDKQEDQLKNMDDENSR